MLSKSACLRRFPRFFALKIIAFFLVLLFLGAFVAAPLWGQTPRSSLRRAPAAKAPARPNRTNKTGPQGDSQENLQTELDKRLAVLRAAFQTGDPQAIRSANMQVLAFGLRQMAELRMVEGSFPQAIELYRQSIQFEDVPKSHVRLALADLQVKKPDDAMEETQKAIFSTPQDAVAWRLQGSAWMQRKDYKKAAEALARSLKLKGDPETAYNLALCFLADHEKDKAKLVFDDILRNVGDTGEAHVTVGRAYRDQNYPDDAAREFRRAIALDPKTPHAHYFLGLLLLMNNQWNPTQEIRDLLNAEIKLYPQDYVSNYLVGMFAAGDKKYDESDRYLGVAASGFPDWPEPPLYMGLNAYGRGDYKAAEALLRKAIELTGADESRGDYQIRRGYIALGRILLQTDRKPEAAKYFEKSRKLLQDALAFSQQTVSNTIASQGGEVGMGAVMPLVAKKLEQQAVSDVYFGDPADQVGAAALAKLTPEEKQQAQDEEKYLRQILGSGFNDLGTSEARQQQFDSAFQHFQQAERWNPEIPGLGRNLGVAAFKVGNYREATNALSKQLAANPTDASVRAMLGISQFSSNQFADAAKTFDPLGDVAMSEPGIAYPWAASLARTGQTSRAGEILAHLEQQQVSPDTLFLIGQTWSELGDYPHAIRTFHRALEGNPTLPKAHYSAGLASINLGKPAEAEIEFQAELKQNPADNDAKYHLAYAYLQDNQADQALPLLENVVVAEPTHADAQYQLGKLMFEKGKVDEAVQFLERAEKLSPEKDYIHYQLQAAYRKESRPQDADRELELYKETKARNRERTMPQMNQPQPNP